MKRRKEENSMPKRFTATEKWQDKWFRSLDVKYKMLWLYILDSCNHAGIWEADLDLATFYTSYRYEAEETISTFGDHVQIINCDKWFIPKFIFFQYGVLHSSSNIHSSVLQLLDKYGLIKGYLTLQEGFLEGYLTPKDKDKDKDKDKNIRIDKKIKEEIKNIITYKDKKLFISESLFEEFCSEFSRELLMREIPKMERWLKFNKPKKDYKRFIFNWLNKEHGNGTHQQTNGQGYKKSGAGGASTDDDVVRTLELARKNTRSANKL